MKTAQEIDGIVQGMIRQVSEPLTEDEEALVHRALASIEERYVHGRHQLFALGLDEEDDVYEGLQLDMPIGQDSVCAEIPVISAAALHKRQLRLLVTAHKKRPDEGGEIHVVASCESCCARLLHLHPNTRVVIESNGGWVKIPVQALLPLPYKRRVTSPNGLAHAQFPS